MTLSNNDQETSAGSEKYSRLFFPNAVSLTRAADGILLDVNEAFEQLTGYRRDEVVGRRTAQLGCWLDPAQWKEACRALNGRGEASDLSIGIRRKDGGFADSLITLSRIEIDKANCYLAMVREAPKPNQETGKGCRREEESRANLDTLLFSDLEISGEDVRRIIDIKSIQELMNSFYRLTKIGIGLLDLKGNILVATGWQDICTKFHRMHPQTLANCIESDTYLSRHADGEKYSFYKCKNNMWDMAIPITLGGRDIASLFLGQFLFEDEEPDLEVFSQQADAYGFDKEEYLAALEQIPRMSRETVKKVVEFYSHLAYMITELSYRNVRLAQTLVERTRAEEALRESEQNFSKYFQAAPSALCISTISEGRYLEVNETFERLTGYRREEVLGRTSLELNIWEDPHARARFLDVFLRDGKVRDQEARFRIKSGKILDALISAEVVEVGKERRLLTLVLDVTARKQAEEALKISETEKSVILNSTMDMVVYHDRDMKLLWGNQKALDSWGMPLEKLVGRHCWEIWHQRDRVCGGCPVISALETGEPREAEIITPDGQQWYVRGFPVKDENGGITGVVEFRLNITECKRTELALLESKRLLESEKRFRSLFENLLEGVACCRMLYGADGEPADFVYLDVNGAFSELIGSQDIVGKRVSELIPGIKESCPDLLEAYGRVALTGRPEKFETYLEPLSLWRSMSVYSTEKGCFVSISENITERKRVEGKLIQSHLKLQQLTANLNLRRERERKEIARRVHDELGTALTLLKFDLAWLKRHHCPEDRSVAERISGMEELIHEGTKTVQRITSELRPSLLDEQGLIATIEWQARKFEKRTGISCLLDFDTALPALSQDQSINVFRILQETLSNVMRHARASGVEISLAKKAGQILLRMADNGVGITNQEIAAPTSFGILGMEERARLCGGDMTIEGVAGKGTIIRVSIPV